MLERHDVARLRFEFTPDLAPPHVPFSKVFRNHAAFSAGEMYFQVS